MNMNSSQIMETVVKAMDSKKAIDIKVLDISSVTTMADYFVICQGNSGIQMKAISEEIEENFGSRVRTLVEAETEDKRADLPPESTWKIRKEESLIELASCNDTAVLMLWLGDKLSNMRSFYRIWKNEGNSMWQAFNQKDPVQQKWYYTRIAELTSSLKDFSAWQEYNELVKIVFGKVN